jgi:hypothetical protein
LGGKDWIPFFGDMGIIAVLSLAVLWAALRFAVADDEMVRYVKELNEVPPTAP